MGRLDRPKYRLDQKPCALIAVIDPDQNRTGVADFDLLRDTIANASNSGVVIVASGPEHVTLPLLGELGPFDAADVEMAPCILNVVICVGWLS